MSWLYELTLSPKAHAARRQLSVAEFLSLERSIEMLAICSARPVNEIADRLLCAYQAMVDEEPSGLAQFNALIADVIEENEESAE